MQLIYEVLRHTFLAHEIAGGPEMTHSHEQTALGMAPHNSKTGAPVLSSTVPATSAELASSQGRRLFFTSSRDRRRGGRRTTLSPASAASPLSRGIVQPWPVSVARNIDRGAA